MASVNAFVCNFVILFFNLLVDVVALFDVIYVKYENIFC